MDPSWNMAAYRARTFRPRTYKPAKPVGPSLTDPAMLARANSAFLDFSCSGCGYVICGCVSDKWCNTCDMEVAPDHDVVGCAEAHRARAEMAAYSARESQRVLDVLKGSCAFDLPGPAKRYQIIEAYATDVAPPDDVTAAQVVATLNRWASMHQASGFCDMSEKFKARCQSWLISMEWSKNPQPDGLTMMQLLASFAEKPKAPEPEPKTGTPADFARQFTRRPAFQQLELVEPEPIRFMGQRNV